MDSDTLSLVLLALLLAGICLILAFAAIRVFSKRHAMHFKLIFENSQDVVWLFDLQGRVLVANPASERLTGYRDDEIIGQTYHPFVHPDSLEVTVHAFQQAIEGRTVTEEITIVHKNGSPLHLIINKIPLTENGRVTGIYGIGKDMTEVKRTEQAYLDSQQKYIQIFHHATDAICLAEYRDGQPRFVDANPSLLHLLGYSRDELLHLHPNQITDPAYVELIPEKTALFQQHHQLITEWVLVGKHGQKIDVEMSLRSFPLHGTRLDLAIMRDITERKKSEELLRKTDKLLVAGQLAAGVAHEIRNPLTSIRGFVELKKAGIDKPEYLDILLMEINRMDDIIGEFLMLAKPQSCAFVATDITKLLEDTCTLFGPQAMLYRTQLILEIQQQLPTITCHPDQIKQVLINLLKNALESMQSGGEIRLQAELRDQDHLLMRIIDQGCGIPDERLHYIAEPFYSTKEKGTGLGLMVSFKIIREHGGQIEIESHVDQGTTVSIILPTAP